MKKTILVVGGAGFVGSHVNKMLHNSGYATVVFDNLSHGDSRAVTQGHFVKGDIGSSRDLEQVFSRYSIDAVMHFAALIDVRESIADPAKYYHNNVGGTLNLLESARKRGVHFFIFSSSAAIFGIPKAPFVSEEHACEPINPYGESKLMVEKILQSYDYAYGLKSSCLRYFNAAGGDPDGKVKTYVRKETNLIPIILQSLKSGKPVMIFGTDYPTPDGTCIRDYVHVNDLGRAHIIAMERLFEGGSSSCYNLGNGSGFSVKDVIRTAERVTGLKANIIEGKRRLGDPAVLVADAGKAMRELHWKPEFPSLEVMISHAWLALGEKVEQERQDEADND
jgi:UDP-glucose 4-epimerase